MIHSANVTAVTAVGSRFPAEPTLFLSSLWATCPDMPVILVPDAKYPDCVSWCERVAAAHPLCRCLTTSLAPVGWRAYGELGTLFVQTPYMLMTHCDVYFCGPSWFAELSAMFEQHDPVFMADWHLPILHKNSLFVSGAVRQYISAWSFSHLIFAKVWMWSGLGFRMHTTTVAHPQSYFWKIGDMPEVARAALYSCDIEDICTDEQMLFIDIDTPLLLRYPGLLPGPNKLFAPIPKGFVYWGQGRHGASQLKNRTDTQLNHASLFQMEEAKAEAYRLRHASDIETDVTHFIAAGDGHHKLYAELLSMWDT